MDFICCIFFVVYFTSISSQFVPYIYFCCCLLFTFRPHSLRDLVPRPGMEPVPLRWEDGVLALEPQGSPRRVVFECLLRGEVALALPLWLAACQTAALSSQQLQLRQAQKPRRWEVNQWTAVIPIKLYLWTLKISVQFSSVTQSCPTLWPHESQRARPPCPSLTPGVHSDSRPSSRWCHPAISSSVVPFSSCPQSLPASESFPMSIFTCHNLLLLIFFLNCLGIQKSFLALGWGRGRVVGIQDKWWVTPVHESRLAWQIQLFVSRMAEGHLWCYA